MSISVMALISLVISCNNSTPPDAITPKTEVIVKTKTPLTEKQIGESNYFISIPTGYSITASDGPDFSVYYFSPTDTTLRNKLNGGLYFGNFPHEFRPANDSCKREYRKGKILGEIRDWTVYNCDGNYSIQAITDSKSGQDWNQKIHVFGHGKSYRDLDVILEIYETLRKNK